MGEDNRQKMVLRRKALFANDSEMLQRLTTRFPYVTWQPQVLQDYCAHALGQPTIDNLRPLLCTPAIEAANYAYSDLNPEADLSQELELLADRRQRATVLRAAPDPGGELFKGSPTDPTLAKRLGTN